MKRSGRRKIGFPKNIMCETKGQVFILDRIGKKEGEKSLDNKNLQMYSKGLGA